MTPHAPAACHDCGKETCVASLSGGLLDRLDCARAKSARLEAESTRLRAILTGSLALANAAAGGVPTEDLDLLPMRIEDAVKEAGRDARGHTAQEAAAIYKQDRADLAFWIRQGDMNKARETLAAIDTRQDWE